MDESLILTGVNINTVQILSILGSFGFLLFILFQIHSKRMREEYSVLWLLLGAVFITFSLWRSGLDHLSRLMGVAYPPAALFLILIMAVFMILIQFSVIISRATENNKHLTQEHSMLKLEVKLLKKKLQNLEKKLENSASSPETGNNPQA
jgi:hypothetical protein